MHIELVCYPGRKVAKPVARDERRRDAVPMRMLQLEVLSVHASHEDARFHPERIVPRFHTGDILQKKPLLWVHGERLVVPDGEAGCIEEVNTVEKLAEPGVRHPRPALIPRCVPSITVPSLEGNLVASFVGDHKGVAAADVFPRCFRVPVTDVRDGDDVVPGDRLQLELSQRGGLNCLVYLVNRAR